MSPARWPLQKGRKAQHSTAQPRCLTLILPTTPPPLLPSSPPPCRHRHPYFSERHFRPVSPTALFRWPIANPLKRTSRTSCRIAAVFAGLPTSTMIHTACPLASPSLSSFWSEIRLTSPLETHVLPSCNDYEGALSALEPALAGGCRSYKNSNWQKRNRVPVEISDQVP